jgi:hypothetical protein
MLRQKANISPRYREVVGALCGVYSGTFVTKKYNVVIYGRSVVDDQLLTML